MPRRPLTPTEIAEARLVFGPGLDYSNAFVAEGATWPNLVDRIGALIQRRKHGLEHHNAVTLGNTSYFPIKLQTSAEAIARGELRDISWLIHELTHQWQYQHLGWRYLASAVTVQVREGRRSYNYQREHASPEAALNAARKAGRRLLQFNPEQQGDIARDYYYALKRGADCSAWEPFVQEFHRRRGDHERG